MIYPINKSLYDLAESILKKNNIPKWGQFQVRSNYCIINTHMYISECLYLDNSGKIIDGFVNRFPLNWKYNDYTFTQLLTRNFHIKDKIWHDTDFTILDLDTIFKNRLDLPTTVKFQCKNINYTF